MGKMSSALLLFIILLTIESAIFSLAKNTTFGCIEGEKKALLNFRATLLDKSNMLSSWNTKNCCTWQGIECDKITGHVIRLDLKNSNPSDDNMLLGKMVDSSISELKYLSYLDLSWNDFQLSKIPAFLGSMKQLQYLNLSCANFSGIVPHQLGNLSSLRVLDLSVLYLRDGPNIIADVNLMDPSYAGELIVNDFMWAFHLSSLEHLDMSGVNLSRTKNLLQVLNMLPSVSILGLSGSRLDNASLPHACVNLTLNNIKHLDLSFNEYYGEFPCFLHNMTSLRVLDLSYNHYNSCDTHLSKLRNLVHVDLFYNKLHHEVDWISEFLQDKCHLKSLNLNINHLHGEISRLFRNLSGCWIHKLEGLTLKKNQLYGLLPEELGELEQLHHLDLSFNNLSGPIPSSLGNLRALRVLNLEFNKLNGEVPLSLGQLSNLEHLDISYNAFNGTLSEAYFANFSNLKYLDTSSNFFKVKVPLGWIPPFQLNFLYMQSCEIGGQFPRWLQSQKELTILDLSSCSISGTFPNWLHNINLYELYLSNNHFKGPIPKLASTLEILHMSNNMIRLPNNIGHMIPLVEDFLLAQNSINGSIPDSLCQMKALWALDLSKNHLSGNLPDCLGYLQHLQALRLSSNELSGVIPNSIGGASSLLWLNLNNNSLIDQLPTTLKNCTRLKFLDVGENELSGKLPEWIGKYLLDLKFLILRDNEFYGVIPNEFCQLPQLQLMDLAKNKLTGKIPQCFGNFSGMVKDKSTDWIAQGYFSMWLSESLNQVMKGVELEYTRTTMYLVNLDLSSNNLVGEIPTELTSLSGLLGLNLSHNQLGGKIPGKIGDLESLESLDLSSNNLFGIIPESLTDLSFLSHLNLSHNNLSGQIPTGHQLQTLDDPSIYDGNEELCGAPLLKKCHDGDASKAYDIENHETADEEDKVEKVIFYGVITCGFATGFWGVIGVLVFKRSWRQSFFQFIEVVIGKIVGL